MSSYDFMMTRYSTITEQIKEHFREYMKDIDIRGYYNDDQVLIIEILISRI